MFRQPVIGVFTTDSEPPLKFDLLLRSLYGPVLSGEKVHVRSKLPEDRFDQGD